MSRRRFEGFLIIIWLVLHIVSLFLPLSTFEFPSQTGYATVAVSPSSITGSVGQSFGVNVTVTNVTDSSGLYGWEFRLNWTVSILNVSNIVEGSFLKSGGGSTFFSNSFDNAKGHMIADCTLEGPVNGVTGGGILATITFHIIDAGQSTMNLYNATLVDANEIDIPCKVVGSYGNFTSSVVDICLIGGRMPLES
jgi:hypothetical protein